jgi:hypothetical protein
MLFSNTALFSACPAKTDRDSFNLPFSDLAITSLDNVGKTSGYAAKQAESFSPFMDLSLISQSMFLKHPFLSMAMIFKALGKGKPDFNKVSNSLRKMA